ncbi:interleukin-15 receptor subunit alpha isoform X2 [Pungitius pungitius]|uniref:interleukin-15 receptor subunit alpha isoform X2 n=1 Tax=Pungitius pungitius TaxID=134920 RepID=UPI002E1261B7
MDLGSRFAFFSVCLIVTCVLRSTRCSNDKVICPCPRIPPRPLTLNPPEKCYEINQTFRYECQEGLLRKVGTSNFIRCKQIGIGRGQWEPSEPTLECIPDPKLTQPPKSPVTTLSAHCSAEPNRTTTQQTESTVTKGHDDIPHTFTIANTITASSGPQTTQKLRPSASVPAESDWPEPTPSIQQALSGPSQAGTERDVTETPTTPFIAAPLNGTAHPPEAFPHAARKYFSLSSAAVISCGTLVIACTLVGIGFFCYRRRRPKSHSPPPEEQIPMKEDPSEQ